MAHAVATRSALTVIQSEVSNANEVEGSRTASRQRSRYRFWGLAYPGRFYFFSEFLTQPIYDSWGDLPQMLDCVALRPFQSSKGLGQARRERIVQKSFKPRVAARIQLPLARDPIA